MDDFLGPLVFMIALMLLVFLGIFGIVTTIEYVDCLGFESGTGIKTKWAWGCYAEVDGKWVPKQYAFGDAHELRVKARTD